jgi:hypothetical protein
MDGWCYKMSSDNENISKTHQNPVLIEIQKHHDLGEKPCIPNLIWIIQKGSGNIPTRSRMLVLSKCNVKLEMN